MPSGVVERPFRDGTDRISYEFPEEETGSYICNVMILVILRLGMSEVDPGSVRITRL